MPPSALQLMPSKASREKKRAQEAAAMGPRVTVNLRPFNVAFVFLVSQLAVLQYFTGFLNGTNMVNGSWIQLEGFHPVIFNFLAQWLLDSTVWPLRDCSASASASSMLDILDITFSTLMDTTHDANPYAMTAARKLVQAYYMGLRMGAYHFMDAIMNVIIRNLRVVAPPSPDQVFQVCMRAGSGNNGFRKLFVDAYIWVSRMNGGQVPRLSDYMAEFQADVNATLRNLQTGKYTFDATNPANPRNREMMDVEINFAALENCLCHGNQGTLKCRYHVHPATDPCWNLIVDTTPVVLPAPRPTGARRRH
ncbi:hypothetical protein HBI48_047370 [Parastagonospora nodorum]|nr:hypothetical protein HBI48_047370 [Parastagonospora nodorum]